MPAPAPLQPAKTATGLTKPGMAAVLLHQLQSNAFVHREIVALGEYEFLVHAARSDQFGLKVSDYCWIFRKLRETKPPDLSELPNGTILDEHGHVVPATADDLKNAEVFWQQIAAAPTRVFLTDADAARPNADG